MGYVPSSGMGHHFGALLLSLMALLFTLVDPNPFRLVFVSTFHELWCSMMRISLLTEVVAMGYISTGMGDRFGALSRASRLKPLSALLIILSGLRRCRE